MPYFTTVMALLRNAPAVDLEVLIVALLVSSALFPHSQLPGTLWRCRLYRSHNLATAIWTVHLHIPPEPSLR
jgi:hypothetical protein